MDTVSAIIGGLVALLVIGAWVGRYLKATPEEQEDIRDLATATAVALAVTRAEALLKGESGAQRKAWVITELQKSFPGLDPTFLDAAIEKAVALLNRQQTIATAGHRGQRGYVAAQRGGSTYDRP